MRLVLTPRQGTASVLTPSDAAILIGRDDAATVRLDSKKVSSEHARIEWQDGKPVLFDAGSTNGTEVGHRPLKNGVGRLLTDGTAIVLGAESAGGVIVDVTIEAPKVEPRAATTKELALELARAESTRRRDHPSIVVVEGSNLGAELELKMARGSVVGIGRSEVCLLVLDDSKVSSLHLEVRRVDDDIEVRDPGSRHGAWLGHDKLGATWTRWVPGEQIALGNSVIVLVGERRPTKPVSVEIEDGGDQAKSAAPPDAVAMPAPSAAESVPSPDVQIASASAAPVAEVTPAKPSSNDRPKRRLSAEIVIYVGAVGVLAVCLFSMVWILVGK